MSSISQPLNVKGRALPVPPRQFDYYNAMLINTVDEDGNSLELGGEFPLEENEHFNNLPVNTQQSDVQIPTNVYNKGQRSAPPPAASAAANGKLKCFVCLCVSRPQHPERHLQLGGAERRLHE